MRTLIEILLAVSAAAGISVVVLVFIIARDFMTGWMDQGGNVR